MKKLPLVLVAALFALTSIHAQEIATANKEVKADASGPAISWVSQQIDLGTVPQGKPAIATFKLTNTGNQPLLLTAVDCPYQSWRNFRNRSKL
jgi:hypothetical protein